MSTRPQTVSELNDLPSPSLILDEGLLRRNVKVFADRISHLGVRHRAHFKTAKSLNVFNIVTAQMETPRIAVSTLKEAEIAAAHGLRDIYYTTPITPQKIADATALIEAGVRFCVSVDTVEGAAALVERHPVSAPPISAIIEIDADGYRGGVSPKNPIFHDIAVKLHAAQNIEFEGLYVFAGRTYTASSPEDGAAIVETCRVAIAAAADLLRDKDIPVDNVVIGGSPVAKFAKHLTGVDEICSGVYMFQDLYQAGLGVCQKEDLVVCVLATVIGVNLSTHSAFIDAGALALSQDISANKLDPSIGYGLASSTSNHDTDLYVESVSQEHGRLKGLNGVNAAELLKLGDRVAVWPNHVCMTVDGFDGYHVLDGGSVQAFWRRTNGW